MCNLSRVARLNTGHPVKLEFQRNNNKKIIFFKYKFVLNTTLEFILKKFLLFHWNSDLTE